MPMPMARPITPARKKKMDAAAAREREREREKEKERDREREKMALGQEWLDGPSSFGTMNKKHDSVDSIIEEYFGVGIREVDPSKVVGWGLREQGAALGGGGQEWAEGREGWELGRKKG